MVRVAFIMLMVILAVSAKEVQFRSCDNVESEQCTVSEVRVSPCTSKKRCRLSKGNDVQISFDFTPKFSAEKLLTDVYWTTVRWDALDADACKATTCPSVEGTQQQFNATMHLGKKLPNGVFEFRWQVYDEADETKKCCFRIEVQLRK